MEILTPAPARYTTVTWTGDNLAEIEAWHATYADPYTGQPFFVQRDSVLLAIYLGSQNWMRVYYSGSQLALRLYEDYDGNLRGSLADSVPPGLVPYSSVYGPAAQ